MKNAFNKKIRSTPGGNLKANPGYEYFHQYTVGMGRKLTAYRWAWHAYTDGELTHKDRNAHRPSSWWPRYELFQKAVDAYMKHSTHPHPNIWLTEQGVLYYNHNEPQLPAKNGNIAEGIMKAYVADGAHQLTETSGQITRFFYYSTRGDIQVFDSGLLEPTEILGPEGKDLANPNVNQPRRIYRYYKAKTNRPTSKG